MIKKWSMSAPFLALILAATACGSDSGPTTPATDPGQRATQLLIAEIGQQNAGVPFDVRVTLADAEGSPIAADASSTITLNVGTGSGSLRGSTSGTLASGSSSLTITGVAYDGAEAGVRLRATGEGGTANAMVALSNAFTLLFDFSEARVAFRRTRPGRQDIYLINADGSAFINITDHPGSDSDPVWSPDGSRIAFVSNRSGSSELYVMNLDGTGLARLTDDPGSVRFPSWSPGGSMIAFSTNRGGQRDIFAIPVPGASAISALGADAATVANQAAECRLTNHPETDNEPVWVRTPDGEWIFFFSSRDAESGVFRMEIDCEGGAIPIRISLDLEWACSPGSGWSLEANRAKVSVVGEAGGQRDIYVMDFDGSNVKNVTNHPGSDFSSTWTSSGLSPNGTSPAANSYASSSTGEEARLIFDSRRSGRWQLYSIREDGTDLVRLTNNDFNDEYPAWRPMANDASATGAPGSSASSPTQGVRTAGALASNPRVASTPTVAAPVGLFDRGAREQGRSCERDG